VGSSFVTFGQQSGPPASARQLRDLQALLERAGYGGFREARGPLGFTQRQGLGKFTSAEAAELIERLEAEGDPDAEAMRHQALLGDLPSAALAVELERRGWILIPPEGG
jgi:hypothetical protein